MGGQQATFEFREAEPAPVAEEERLSLEERFELWLEGHGTEVYRNFVEIAKEIRDSGRERFGGKAIAEIARYRRFISGQDTSGFKVNNSFVSLMVRKLISEDPDFNGFFELRVLKS